MFGIHLKIIVVDKYKMKLKNVGTTRKSRKCQGYVVNGIREKEQSVHQFKAKIVPINMRKRDRHLES